MCMLSMKSLSVFLVKNLEKYVDYVIGKKDLCGGLTCCESLTITTRTAIFTVFFSCVITTCGTTFFTHVVACNLHYLCPLQLCSCIIP